MTRLPTETALREWRYGQTQAERLCAAILHAEGYGSIDPQCPLGGPDDKKDILCTKDGDRYVAACYFPPTHQDFKSIKKKFEDDLVGVSRHGAAGFAFIVNQPVTPSEREELSRIGGVCKTDIFHIERIRSILDSPKGYGIRLEHLRIVMTEEEQYAFWSSFQTAVSDRFLTYDAGIKELEQKLDMVLSRTNAMHIDLLSSRSSLLSVYGMVSSFPTEQLSTPLVLWLHKLSIDNETYRSAVAGELRGVQVWIGGPGSSPETAQHVPPPATDVPRLLEDLLFAWRTGYQRLANSGFEERLASIARFHHRFLSIHPFLDANGRVARCILEQQALELLGKRVSQDFVSQPGEYFEYLNAADKGSIEPLVGLLRASLQ